MPCTGSPYWGWCRQGRRVSQFFFHLLSCFASLFSSFSSLSHTTTTLVGPATTQNLVVKFDGEICGGVLVEYASDDFPRKRSSKISFQTSPEVRHQFRRKLRQLQRFLEVFRGFSEALSEPLSECHFPLKTLANNGGSEVKSGEARGPGSRGVPAHSIPTPRLPRTRTISLQPRLQRPHLGQGVPARGWGSWLVGILVWLWEYYELGPLSSRDPLPLLT